MPIPLPDLDDLTFAELTDQARALIPGLYPDWTDHNPSDPGIALVELLAWFTEMLLFGTNEIPDRNVDKFLRLLNGPDWAPAEGEAQADAVRGTLLRLSERYRATTADDYEYLVTHTWPGTGPALELGPAAGVRRVRCLPARNLSAPDPATRAQPAPGQLSVVVLPDPGPDPADVRPQPDPGLLAGLAAFFEPRRILTTGVHVVGPEYVDVGVGANLALREDAPPDAALASARAALSAFAHPYTGGLDGAGWPFGRAVYVSEVDAALERLPLIDFVEEVALTGPEPILDDDRQVCGVALDDHQLVRLARLDLVGFDVFDRQHPLTWTAP